jgi:hypothetical protein
MARLQQLRGLAPVLARREQLLKRLEQPAPVWARSIAQRTSSHAGDNPPGDAESAWLWRQITQELDRRAQFDVPAIERQIDELGIELRRTVARLGLPRLMFTGWSSFRLRGVDGPRSH